VLDFFGLKFSKDARALLLAAGAMILILFAGLRFECDNDYATYADIYERAPGLVAIFKGKASLNDVYGEYLFGFWCILLKTFNLPAYALFLSIAFFTFYTLCKVILRFSEYPFASLLLYVSMYFLASGFTQIRFGLATSLAWVGLFSLYENKLGRYFGYLVLASMFHISALIVFIVYFLRNFKLNTVRVYIIIAISVLISFLNLSNLIVSMIGSAISQFRYATYLEQSQLLSKTNNYSILLYSILTVVYWNCRHYYSEIHTRKMYEFLLRIALISLLSSAFLIQLYITSRIALLLQLVFVFIMPMVLCLPRIRYYCYSILWLYATFRYAQFFTVDTELRFIQEYQSVLF
jgi:hypothetical protein